MRTISGLSGNGPRAGASETQENDAGDAASVCAKELMEGVDIQDSFIISQGESVTSEVSDNVFIFTKESWGPELDTETGLEVCCIHNSDLSDIRVYTTSFCQPSSY